MSLDATDIASVADMPAWWPEISIGIFFWFLGVAGAAIMVYLGEWDRLMGKSARILELEEEIRSKREIANKLNGPNDVDTRKKWEDIIDIEEKRLYAQRKDNRNLGVILYLFIGGVIASILANGVLEAVAVGAGWTGFLGLFAIKKDSDERRRVRDKKDDEDLKEMKELLTKEAQSAYYKGYYSAIEQVAKEEDTTVENVLGKLGYEVE